MNISIKHLNKTYQNHQALNNINLEIKSGSVFGLLGPNGAGKTTLIRIRTQILTPDSGEIFLNNERQHAKHMRLIGYLPEERGLYKKMSVGEQILFFAQLKGMSLVNAKKELKKWAQKFDMINWLPKKVEELSKGMQQKVQFITTVINNPELLILDEPFSGFDPLNAQNILEEIKLLNKAGTTIIFSSHRMESVELLCNEIGLINKSELIIGGDINKLKQQYKSNCFKVCYNGDPLISDNTIVVTHTNIDKETNISFIKPAQQMDTRLILKHLISLPINIISFEEELTIIEDIFLKVVS